MTPETILETLTDHGVEFVLVGGLAATVHGSSLATFDIDVCFRQEPDNCRRLAGALDALEAQIYPIRSESIPISPELLLEHRLVHLKSPAGRLDLIVSVPGLGTYDEIAPETDRVDLFGRGIKVLSPDQLIVSKKALDQPKDPEQLDQLLALRDLESRGD